MLLSPLVVKCSFLYRSSNCLNIISSGSGRMIPSSTLAHCCTLSRYTLNCSVFNSVVDVTRTISLPYIMREWMSKNVVLKYSCKSSTSLPLSADIQLSQRRYSLFCGIVLFSDLFAIVILYSLWLMFNLSIYSLTALLSVSVIIVNSIYEKYGKSSSLGIAGCCGCCCGLADESSCILCATISAPLTSSPALFLYVG